MSKVTCCCNLAPVPRCQESDCELDLVPSVQRDGPPNYAQDVYIINQCEELMGIPVTGVNGGIGCLAGIDAVVSQLAPSCSGHCGNPVCS
jgi:hypothetical protein